MLSVITVLALHAVMPGPVQAGAVQHCETGSAEVMLGGTRWIAHGCGDGVSLRLEAAPDSPAAPFAFLLTPAGGDDGGYAISGDRGDLPDTEGKAPATDRNTADGPTLSVDNRADPETPRAAAARGEAASALLGMPDAEIDALLRATATSERAP